jgi:hypothetical protein
VSRPEKRTMKVTVTAIATVDDDRLLTRRVVDAIVGTLKRPDVRNGKEPFFFTHECQMPGADAFERPLTIVRVRYGIRARWWRWIKPWWAWGWNEPRPP